MKLEYSSAHPSNCDADTLVLFVPELQKLKDKALTEIDAATGGAVTTLVESGEFVGKRGQMASVMHPVGYLCRRVILVGLGSGKTLSPESYRIAGGHLSGHEGVKNSSKAAFWFGKAEDAAFFQAAIEGFLLGGFKLLEFKTGDDAEPGRKLKHLAFVVENRRLVPRLQKAIERGQTIAEGQILVRRLASMPANYLTPKMFATEAGKLARKNGVRCTVLDEKAIAREKMGAFLSVSQGSSEPPRLVRLEYNGGREGQKPIVLVGKGVTFDSGGISIKPSLNMHLMKADMTGAAIVLAGVMTAARLKLKVNVVGLVPCAENLPSGTATKPGDIVLSRKGLSIEVINTDAEGRLLLADALSYADRFKPQAVIDVATLTGATLYILGYAGAPILGNNPKLKQRLRDASEATSELVWELPIWDEHRDQMKSTIADLVNAGGKPAGTIAAAAFLENFVGDWPWAHIDIAYVDHEPKGKPYSPKGATGFGLRLLIDMLSHWKKL